MNTNGSRNWLLWLAIILAVVAVVYFVRTRMMKSEASAPVATEEMATETQVDAVPAPESSEVVAEQAEEAA